MALKLFTPKIKHKQFSFMPRYYDERKERLELKRKAYSDEALENDERGSLMKEKLRDTWAQGRTRQQANYQANFRVIVLIVLIVALGYFVLNGLDDVDNVIHKLMD